MNPEQMTNEELLKMYKGDPSLLSDDALFLLKGQQKPIEEPKPVPEKPVEESQSTPVTEPQTDSAIDSGFLKGIKDPIDAGAQLLPRVLSFLTSAGGLKPNELSNFFRSEAERVDALVKTEEEQYQKERGEEGFDINRLLGNILNPANIAVGLRAAQGAKALGKTGQTLISGGAVGSLTPVTDTDNFVKEKAKQAGIGAVGGVVGEKVIGAAGKVLAPGTKAMQEMRKLGVTGTLGQKLGGMFKSMEEFAKFIPVIGGAIDEKQASQVFNFNKGIISNTLAKIDSKALINFNKLGDETKQTGIEGIKYLKKYLNDSYNNIYNTSGLKFNFNQKTGQQLLDKLNKQGLNSLDDIKEVQKFIDKEISQRTFLSSDSQKINQKGIEIILPKKVNELTGKQYKEIDKILRKKISANLEKNTSLANAYLAIKDTLKDNFYEQNKNVVYKTLDNTQKNAVESLRAIDEGYSKLVAMITASGDLKIKNTAGLFTPETYRKAIRNTDLSRMKQGYLFDTRPGAKEAKEAVEMLGNDAEFYRGREALTRLGRFTTFGGLGGAGVAGADIATTGGLGIVGGRLLYTDAGQKLFDLILMARPTFVRKTGETIQKTPVGVSSVVGAETSQEMFENRGMMTEQ